jgi:hypothetical protein
MTTMPKMPELALKRRHESLQLLAPKYKKLKKKTILFRKILEATA